jgi:hypothetical protein
MVCDKDGEVHHVKLDTLEKHIGNQKATKTLLHLGVKKYEMYMNKKC